MTIDGKNHPETPNGPAERPPARALALSAASTNAPAELFSAALASLAAPPLRVASKADWGNLRQRPVDIDPAMDARLQVALARQESGSPRMALASTGADEIAVIAKVDDAQAWQALSEVKMGVTLGAAGGGNCVIVTGRIPVKRIEAVRRQPFVRSLKASQPIRPLLQATGQDMRTAATLLPAGTAPDGGRGVVIGIVDFGCDFAHHNFRRSDGSSRIEAIWNQAGPMSAAGDVKYGRLHRQVDIDAALNSADPYSALGYGAGLDLGPHSGAHGTHVMDIAAGNGRGSSVPGCAPAASIIFVEASVSDIAASGPTAAHQSLGDSVQLLEAVHFIFEQAGDRPCVVNLSLGTHGGPHDGTTLVEQGLDSLVLAKPNRAVVIAAGNFQSDKIHTEGLIPGGGQVDVLWESKDSPAGQEMELWMAGTSRVAVEIIAPDGTSLGVVEPASNLSIGTDAAIVVYVSNRLDEPNNHDNTIGIYIAGGAGAGIWTLRLFDRGSADVHFHAWSERQATRQSSFVGSVERCTLGSISCGRETICVASYDAHKTAGTLSYFSSNGPTRDGRLKPDLSAPGHAVLAARSASGGGLVGMSGTSMAAPAVTGLVALVLAEAQRRNVTLSAKELRDVVLNGSSPARPGVPQRWDAGYGHGRASTSSLSLLPQSVPAGAAAAPVPV
jgi:subtilisin family serine protease